MSNFACEKCGAMIYDSPKGYVTYCEHYPLEVKNNQPQKKYKIGDLYYETEDYRVIVTRVDESGYMDLLYVLKDKK